MQGIETKTTGILHRMGVPANILGYHYLRDALLLTLESGEKALSVTKHVYPTVAKKNATTAIRVERAIRHAIEVAWNRGDTDYHDEVFGYTIDPERGKPTNSEFINMVVDRMRLEINEGADMLCVTNS